MIAGEPCVLCKYLRYTTKENQKCVEYCMNRLQKIMPITEFFYRLQKIQANITDNNSSFSDNALFLFDNYGPYMSGVLQDTYHSLRANMNIWPVFLKAYGPKLILTQDQQLKANMNFWSIYSMKYRQDFRVSPISIILGDTVSEKCSHLCWVS